MTLIEIIRQRYERWIAAKRELVPGEVFAMRLLAGTCELCERPKTADAVSLCLDHLEEWVDFSMHEDDLIDYSMAFTTREVEVATKDVP